MLERAGHPISIYLSIDIYRYEYTHTHTRTRAHTHQNRPIDQNNPICMYSLCSPRVVLILAPFNLGSRCLSGLGSDMSFALIRHQSRLRVRVNP